MANCHRPIAEQAHQQAIIFEIADIAIQAHKLSLCKASCNFRNGCTNRDEFFINTLRVADDHGKLIIDEVRQCLDRKLFSD